eukprot:jgi/Orpsp1_1/1176376/evm.model.c7180000057367.1
MNCNEDFLNFVNYLQRNNYFSLMNFYSSNFPNSFNTNHPFDQVSNMFYSMNQRYNELDRKIDRLNHFFTDFTFHSNGKRKRMSNRFYDSNNSNGNGDYGNNNYYDIDYHSNYGNDYRDRNNSYDRHHHRHRYHSTSSTNHRNNKNNRYDNRKYFDRQDFDSYGKNIDNSGSRRHKRQRYLNSRLNKDSWIEDENDENETCDSDDESIALNDQFKANNKNNSKAGKRKNKVYFQIDNEKNIKKNKGSDTESENNSDNESENDDNDSDSDSDSDNGIITKNNHKNNFKNKVENKKSKSKYNVSRFKANYYYPKIKKESKKKYLIVLDIFNLLYQRVNIDSVSSLIKVNPHYKIKNAYIYLRPYLDTFLKELFNLNKKYNKINNNYNDSDNENDNENEKDKNKDKDESDESDNEEKEEEYENGFEIAIWNTAKPHMVSEITQLILNHVPVDYIGEKRINYMKKLHFIWTIDQCQPNEDMKDDEAPRFLRTVDTIINSKEINDKNGTIYPPVNEFDHWKK